MSKNLRSVAVQALTEASCNARLFCLVGVGVGLLFVAKGMSSSWVPSVTRPAVAAFPVEGISDSKLCTKPIEEIRVGDRVAGKNPIREQVEQLKIDPKTWHLVRLRMSKDEGRSVAIDLLRSPEWLAAVGGKVGAQVNVDLYELGAVGYAEVLEILNCPPLDMHGNGTIVTGVFAHQPSAESRVLSIRLQGEDKATGVTSKHPFWSEERREFVEAGDLKIGELVSTSFGIRSVASIESDPDYHDLVFTLETTEHVYRAGSLGTLVHNASVTSGGVTRNNPKDWRQLRDLWDKIGLDDILSNANRAKIAKGRVPIVDDEWISHFP
ncbi:MAG: hypothetical protein ABI614_04690, partial [Planctomycetota bacterium]